MYKKVYRLLLFMLWMAIFFPWDGPYKILIK